MTLLISNKLTNQNTFGSSENLFLPKDEDQVKVDEVLLRKEFPRHSSRNAFKSLKKAK